MNFLMLNVDDKLKMKVCSLGIYEYYSEEMQMHGIHFLGNSETVKTVKLQTEWNNL